MTIAAIAIIYSMLMMGWGCYRLGKQAGERRGKDTFNRLSASFDQLADARTRHVAALEEQITMLRKAAGLPELPAKQVEGTKA